MSGQSTTIPTILEVKRGHLIVAQNGHLELYWRSKLVRVTVV